MNSTDILFNRNIRAESAGDRSCYKCKHYQPGFQGVNDSYPEGPECEAHPGRTFLKSFPFLNTICKSFENDRPKQKADADPG